MPLPADCAELAAVSGSVPMLKLLQQEHVAFTTRTSGKAAAGGHLPALQFLHSAACPMDWRADDAAAKRGDLPMLKFLHSIGHRLACYTLLISAAESGSVEVMAWLVERGAELRSFLLQMAAWCHHLQLCQYLFDKGCQWTADATDFLLALECLRELKWVLSQGIESTAEQQQQYEKLKAQELRTQQQQQHWDRAGERRHRGSMCGKRKRSAFDKFFRKVRSRTVHNSNPRSSEQRRAEQRRRRLSVCGKRKRAACKAVARVRYRSLHYNSSSAESDAALAVQ
jgi:hypothetical protein